MLNMLLHIVADCFVFHQAGSAAEKETTDKAISWPYISA
jgi:hypothetical protein